MAKSALLLTRLAAIKPMAMVTNKYIKTKVSNMAMNSNQITLRPWPKGSQGCGVNGF
jgi:hypothetical protein